MLNCHLCPAGKVSGVAGSSTCVQCPQGREPKKNGSAACSPCKSGTFRLGGSDAPADTACRECPSGWAQPGQDQTACVQCPQGREPKKNGSAACSPCRSGTHRINNAPDVACRLCPSGWAQQDQDQPSCVMCNRSETTNAGEATCRKCDAGKFGSVPGYCTECEPGRYSDGKGETTCKLCPRDTFNTATGSTTNAECQKCSEFAPHTTTSEQRGVSDPATGCVCGSAVWARTLNRVGYYRVPEPRYSQEVNKTADDAQRAICLPCPPGADCLSDGATLRGISAKVGYWRAGALSTAFVDCSQAYRGVSAEQSMSYAELRCCPAVHPASSSAVNSTSISTSGTTAASDSAVRTTSRSICADASFNLTDPDQQCSHGYRGPLCAGCAHNHVRVLNDCVPCKGGASFGAAFLALALSCLVVSLFVVLVLLKCATRKAAASASGKSLVGQVKILILFAQLLSSMPDAFDAVPWPEQFKLFAIRISLPFTLDFLSAFALGGCHLSLFPLDAFLLHMLLVPLLVVAVSSAYVATVKLPCCLRAGWDAAQIDGGGGGSGGGGGENDGGGGGDNDGTETVSTTKTIMLVAARRRELAIKIFIFAVQLMYPGLAARIFSIFRCRVYEGAVEAPVFVRNLLVACHTGRHAVFEGLAVLFMLLYVAGVPFAVFVALWWNRKHLNDESSPRHNAVKYEFGALYRQFTPRFWYFGESCLFFFFFFLWFFVVECVTFPFFFFFVAGLSCHLWHLYALYFPPPHRRFMKP
jgi:hypothetical protein